ncbi:hypothetical protein ACSVIJ_23675, partial [Pseudomonas sp. NCHU5208]|uniref:hypothetical protein n=1 Tax=unclassified Pseudomonas TaxID=196821 RepID=UPI003F963D6B
REGETKNINKNAASRNKHPNNQQPTPKLASPVSLKRILEIKNPMPDPGIGFPSKPRRDSNAYASSIVRGA